MKFWGVEVKANEPIKVKPDLDHVIHLSKAVLSEPKVGHALMISGDKEEVQLKVKTGLGTNFVLGTFFTPTVMALGLELVFEKRVTFSHNAKHLSIYLTGYQTDVQFDGFCYDFDESDENPGDSESDDGDSDNGSAHGRFYDDLFGAEDNGSDDGDVDGDNGGDDNGSDNDDFAQP